MTDDTWQTVNGMLAEDQLDDEPRSGEQVWSDNLARLEQLEENFKCWLAENDGLEGRPEVPLEYIERRPWPSQGTIHYGVRVNGEAITYLGCAEWGNPPKNDKEPNFRGPQASAIAYYLMRCIAQLVKQTGVPWPEEYEV